MAIINRNKIKRILLTAVWILIGCSSTVLLVAAVKKNEEGKCKGVQIDILGVSNHYFIDKKDVEQIIFRYGGADPVGKMIELFDLKQMETALKKDIWIKDAQMFFDNNGILQVDIEEREPIARVFTRGSGSFYVDSSLMMLPLSEKFSARLPVFTGFPSEARVLRKADSILLGDIKKLAITIQEDPFLMGMIDQVDITESRTFEIIPLIGDQTIVFGDAADHEEKFKKLRLFYKKVIVKTGFSYYSVINLQYKGQVVGKIRGADDITADSLRTVEIMTLIAAEAEKKAADSVRTFIQDSERNTADSTMVMESIQREEGAQDGVVTQKVNGEPVIAVSTTEKTAPTKVKPVASPTGPKKPAVKKKAPEAKKPKAVMAAPGENDY